MVIFQSETSCAIRDQSPERSKSRSLYVGYLNSIRSSKFINTTATIAAVCILRLFLHRMIYQLINLLK